MRVLQTMLRYVVYYIAVILLISIFAGANIRGFLSTLCGASIFVSMFAAVIQMLFGGSCSVAGRISSWCLRGTIVVTAIVVICGIGFKIIAKLI